MTRVYPRHSNHYSLTRYFLGAYWQLATVLGSGAATVSMRPLLCGACILVRKKPIMNKQTLSMITNSKEMKKARERRWGTTVILYTVVREGLSDTVTFDQRPETREHKWIPGKEQSRQREQVWSHACTFKQQQEKWQWWQEMVPKEWEGLHLTFHRLDEGSGLHSCGYT